ncbi:hypothetical protein GGI15_003842 [Coemansia interrupta]|uniref:3-hydroxyisobutyrate dehydrogenase n=1 Tax=Coemansia interrupta TaxID=1126814 RepID=A0A9W8LFK0_9FUNG|nr:hypothetical protein GGI15_003842 [Coemansia interrupta]
MTLTVSTAGLRIGFIGLGNMGQAMALNMQAHRVDNGNPPISVYNRTPSRTLPLSEKGAIVCESPSAVAASSDVVFMSLFNGDSVKQVLAQIFDSLVGCPANDRPLVIADTTSVHPETSRWVVSQLAARQASFGRRVEFSQTPVWGVPRAAMAGKLVIVTSGTERKLVEAVAVPAIARLALDCGADVSRAAKFKILGNFMIGAIMESLAEAMAVAEETGIGRELYLDFVKEMFPVPPVVVHATMMAAQNGEAAKHQVNLNVPGAMKDVCAAIDVAGEAGMRLPIAELVREHLQWVMDNGDSSWDCTSLAFALRKNVSKKE